MRPYTNAGDGFLKKRQQRKLGVSEASLRLLQVDNWNLHACTCAVAHSGSTGSPANDEGFSLRSTASPLDPMMALVGLFMYNCSRRVGCQNKHIKKVWKPSPPRLTCKSVRKEKCELCFEPKPTTLKYTTLCTASASGSLIFFQLWPVSTLGEAVLP